MVHSSDRNSISVLNARKSLKVFCSKKKDGRATSQDKVCILVTRPGVSDRGVRETEILAKDDMVEISKNDVALQLQQARDIFPIIQVCRCYLHRYEQHLTLKQDNTSVSTRFSLSFLLPAKVDAS
jgi:hypothetical protein